MLQQDLLTERISHATAESADLSLLGKGGPHQAVFTVDVGVGHGVYWPKPRFLKDKLQLCPLEKFIQINDLPISINPKGLCLFMIPPVLSFRNQINELVSALFY